MIQVFYTHRDRLDKEYSREFEEPSEAYVFYQKMKHLKDKSGKLYIVSYICTTEFELKVMEGIYKC